MMMRSRFATVLAACTLLLAQTAAAWNFDGHRIVAQIAVDGLSSQARAGVEALIGAPARQTLAEAAVWPDMITASRPETRPWHYVNIPRRAEGYDALRDCPEGACVVGALGQQWAALRDAAAPLTARREALAFVTHLLADMHQPLHCGDGQDRGGNDIVTVFEGQRSNLHRVWDGEYFPWTSLIGQTEDGETAPAMPACPARIDEAAFTAWAEESHRIAVERVYATLPPPQADRSVMLGVPLIEAYWPLARARVKLAARRLTCVLEEVFGGAPVLQER